MNTVICSLALCYVITFLKEEDVVSKDADDDGRTHKIDIQNKGPKNERNETHGKRASLRNATNFFIRLAKAIREGIINKQVIVVPEVRVDDKKRHAKHIQNKKQNGFLNLVKTFLNVRSSTGDHGAVDRTQFSDESSFIPGILSTKARYASI